MRSDADLLRDMLDAIVAIEKHRPASRANFDASEPIQSHLLHQIQIIGEAVTRISESLQLKHPEVPWRQIAGMRNAIVHAYFQIDFNEVWNTVANDIPLLKPQIEKILFSLGA